MPCLGMRPAECRRRRALALERLRLAGGLELEAEDVLAGRDVAVRDHVVVIDRAVVVRVAKLPLLDEEREPAVHAALRHEHAFRAAFGDLDGRVDGVVWSLLPHL